MELDGMNELWSILPKDFQDKMPHWNMEENM